MKKKSNPKTSKIKSFLIARSYPHDKKDVFLGHNSITKDYNLVKISAS
jgi:hypothetical protein